MLTFSIDIRNCLLVVPRLPLALPDNRPVPEKPGNPWPVRVSRFATKLRLIMSRIISPGLTSLFDRWCAALDCSGLRPTSGEAADPSTGQWNSPALMDQCKGESLERFAAYKLHEALHGIAVLCRAGLMPRLSSRKNLWIPLKAQGIFSSGGGSTPPPWRSIPGS